MKLYGKNQRFVVTDFVKTCDELVIGIRENMFGAALFIAHEK